MKQALALLARGCARSRSLCHGKSTIQQRSNGWSATERAFAAATAEIGVRDGFLTFFAPTR